jgi:addiction module HigA family antidote
MSITSITIKRDSAMRMKNPVHPGEILREEYLIPLGLSIKAAAEKIGVTRKALSEVVNERAGVSPLMAWRLSIAFSTSPELWTAMQMGYDLAKERDNPALRTVQLIHRPNGEALAP